MYRQDKRKTVALIYGGRGMEHQVSCLGKSYVEGLIDREKYRILPIFIDQSGNWYIENESKKIPAHLVRIDEGGGLITKCGTEKIDCAIPLLHGDFGEDGRIQGALDVVGVRYIGASHLCGAVCSDKGYTKDIALSLGIPVARYKRIRANTPLPVLKEVCLEFGYPLFIKPACLGSSVGAHEVECEGTLEEIFEELTNLGTDLLIEELVKDKRELEVGFFSSGKTRIITHPGEPKCEGFYGFDEKYSGKTSVLARAKIDEETSKKIAEYSRLLAERLNLRHLARLDFFLFGDRLIFNEINTFPGFTENSLYPRLMKEAGIEPHRLINLMIEDSLS